MKIEQASSFHYLCFNIYCLIEDVVTYMIVTIDGVWIGNWIYWPLIDGNYK
jgi:hypothetical protein